MKKRGVTLRIECIMPERLLNKALESGATFSLVRRTDPHTLITVSDASTAAALSALAARYSIGCHRLSVTGIEYMRQWLLHRRTLLPGIIAGMLLLTLFLSRIWFIRISVLEAAQLPAGRYIEEIEFALKELNITPGIARSLADNERIALQLSTKLNSYSHISIRTRGIFMFVEAAVEKEAPSVYDINNATNLLADRSGIVVSINALTGEACVKPGDIVNRGDILIKGTEQISAEEAREVAAMGEVIARSWQTGEAELPVYEIQKNYTGRSCTTSSLELFGRSIPLLKGEEYSLYECSEELIPVVGLFLPITIRKTFASEYTETVTAAKAEQLKQRLKHIAMADAQAKLPGQETPMFQTQASWINYELTQRATMRAEAVVEYTANIAVTPAALSQGG